MSINKQETAWGSIEWLDDGAQTRSTPVYSALEIMNPGASRGEHILYAEQQLCFTLSGSGQHIVNGKCVYCAEGDYISLPVGCIQAEYNPGPEPWRQLITVIPVQFSTEMLTHSEPVTAETTPADRKFIRETFKSGTSRLASETLSRLSMSVVITDPQHRPVFSTALSGKCRSCEDEDCPIRISTQSRQQEQSDTCSVAVCGRGVTVLIQPVLYDDTIAGFIKGGMFNENPELFRGATSLLNVPGSAFHSSLIFLQDMASYLQDYYRDCLLKRELILQKKEVEQEELYTKAITDAYEQTRNVALNMQLRNHFLFNTLNSIAALAVQDGSMETYKAILNLSDLFRGLLRKEGTRVPLGEELEFLKKYLMLQKLRHEDSLKVVWDLSQEASKVIVPHNFLQPVVENTFVHAFKDNKKLKKITISTEREENRIRITVTDNGCGMDAETLERLRESLYGSSHGLSMVNRKLYGVFGTDFTYRIDSEPGRGTVHTFLLPA